MPQHISDVGVRMLTRVVGFLMFILGMLCRFGIPVTKDSNFS